MMCSFRIVFVEWKMHRPYVRTRAGAACVGRKENAESGHERFEAAPERREFVGSAAWTDSMAS